MTTTDERLLNAAGGCLCGELRYTIQGVLVDAGYCHCRLCQLANGAPVVAWLTVPFAAFTYHTGTPRAYCSSPTYQRESCPTCGTPLVFRRQHGPSLIDVTIVSLDEPARVLPEYHIWRMSRLPWFDTADALPRHDEAGPDQA